nr:ABC transporter permease [Gordonibacter urolithinfaciens]
MQGKEVGVRRTQTAKTALSSISRNRLRTALTMLGLVIGVSSVIVLVGIGDGSNRQVEERMKALGGDMVSAYVFKESLDYDDIVALRGLPGLGPVAPSKRVGGDLTAEGRSTKRSMTEASDEHYLPTRNLRLATGRNLSPVDRENRSNVCVIGATTANDLFGTVECLGKTLKIAGVPFVVVGVLEPIGQAMGLNADALALVPFSALPSLGEETKIETVYARPAVKGSVDTAKAALLHFLSGEKGLSAEQFAVVSQDDMLSASNEINQTMTLMLAGIASISLVVAGIGVMNVMLVSVTERTREIGIKKALGARRSDILRQFLMEALLVSLMGGAAGIAAGLAFGMLAESMGMAFSASWGVVAVAVAASTVIGLSFGIFPAYRASRLTPIEALRQE